jgi:hypothetical protein
MSTAITITATLPAWASSSYQATNMLRHLKDGEPQKAAETMFFASGDMESLQWIRVGEADLTVRVHSESAIVAGQLQALQRELDNARAEWMTKQQEILERISKLQALTNEVEA